MLLALAALSVAQQYRKSHQDAAILRDDRFLSIDGKFGAAYEQEDGVAFKEESDADGNRRGSYSYVDPNGQRRTITYVAGKNGFVASGDDIPQPPPAPVPVAPQPQYQPRPEYNPRPEDDGSWDDGSWREPTPAPQWNPPPQQRNWNAPPPQQFNPTPAPQWNPPPQQYNRPQPSYNPPPQTWTTTPAPHRFYPPGKLSLNRSPEGFSYSFSKN